MERDELKGRQTPGQCEVTDDGRIWGGLDLGDMIADVWIDEHANAALYAEAHNVANRTGLWPEDMVERIKELEDAVAALLPLAHRIQIACHKGEILNFNNDCDAQDAIEYEEVIKNAEALLNKK